MMEFLGCADKPAPFWCMSLVEAWEWLINVPVLGFVVLVWFIGAALFVVFLTIIFFGMWFERMRE